MFKSLIASVRSDTPVQVRVAGGGQVVVLLFGENGSGSEFDLQVSPGQARAMRDGIDAALRQGGDDMDTLRGAFADFLESPGAETMSRVAFGMALRLQAQAADPFDESKPKVPFELEEGAVVRLLGDAGPLKKGDVVRVLLRSSETPGAWLVTNHYHAMAQVLPEDVEIVNARASRLPGVFPCYVRLKRGYCQHREGDRFLAIGRRPAEELDVSDVSELAVFCGDLDHPIYLPEDELERADDEFIAAGHPAYVGADANCAASGMVVRAVRRHHDGVRWWVDSPRQSVERLVEAQYLWPIPENRR